MSDQLEVVVTDMTCGGCEQRISTALARLEGVRRSSADHRSGRVRVAYDPSATSAQEVRERIAQIGYTVAPEEDEG